MTAKQVKPLVRERGKKDVVALTVRLLRAEWERLHRLAVTEGVRIQTLAVRGLNMVFKESEYSGIYEDDELTFVVWVSE